MKAVPCEVYSRVVGYFRPVHNWNKGKQQEFSERVTFTEEPAQASPKLEAAPVITGASNSIESYKVFTFPNCDKCEQVKDYLKDKPFAGSIIDLKTPDGNKEFRKYYASLKNSIKREDDGTLKLPVVLFLNKDNVVSTAQGIEETKTILA